jgi:hypothetical protein
MSKIEIADKVFRGEERKGKRNNPVGSGTCESEIRPSNAQLQQGPHQRLVLSFSFSLFLSQISRASNHSSPLILSDQRQSALQTSKVKLTMYSCSQEEGGDSGEGKT